MADLERDRADRLERLVHDPTTGGGDDVRPLADLAAELRRSMSPSPSEATRRARVWARLAPRLEARRSSRSVWPVLRPAYAIASLAVVIVLGLGTTTAFASEAALPGDALYPVKRGLEQASLALSTTPAADARLAASFADRRLAEVEALIALERWNDAETALAAYPDAIDRLADLDPTEAEGQLSHHLEVLERVRSQVPASTQAGLERAVERAARGLERAKDRQAEHPRPDAPGQQRRESATATETGERIRPTPRRPGGLPPGWEKKQTPTP